MPEKISLEKFIRKIIGIKKHHISPPRVIDYSSQQAISQSPSKRNIVVDEDMSVPYSGHMKPQKMAGTVPLMGFKAARDSYSSVSSNPFDEKDPGLLANKKYMPSTY